MGKKTTAMIVADISDGIKDLTEMINSEEVDNEKVETLVKKIAGDENKLVYKVLGIKDFLSHIDSQREAMRAWKKRADGAIKKLTGVEKRLKEYTLYNLKKIDKNGNGIASDGVRIKYQKQGEKEPVIIDEPDKVPFTLSEYSYSIKCSFDEHVKLMEFLDGEKIAYKSSLAPDKDAVKAELKSGKKVNGARLGEQAEGIRITLDTGV